MRGMIKNQTGKTGFIQSLKMIKGKYGLGHLALD